LRLNNLIVKYLGGQLVLQAGLVLLHLQAQGAED
jgi:hypothetical protein